MYSCGVRTLTLLLLILTFSIAGHAQGWVPADLSFTATAVASSNGYIWVCGSNGSIASTQDGQLWNLRYTQPGGPTLRGINFRDQKFGYAYGDAGAVFLTDDGGSTWFQKTVSTDTILEAALGDSKHGIFRFADRLVITQDGGVSFQDVIQRPYLPLADSYPYGQNLVATDAMHMGLVISEGIYSDGGFLTSSDGGTSWVFYDRPSTGIGTFMAKDGLFWLIGMEVVGKDQPGGGHSIPLMAFSKDGAAWKRTDKDISICHWHVCRTCNWSGCLLSVDQLIDNFGDGSVYQFPSGEQTLTANFAALHHQKGGVICSVSEKLLCAPMKRIAPTDKMGPPAPTVPTFDLPTGEKKKRFSYPSTLPTS